ncbi:TonB-dependent receptor [Marinoscillum sp. 108]|uniref:TonB-dependent receptor n=1 Tax=Marinoscillum luteum TaxID=861051 RepID=A0ABW7N9X7_9BACT|nr:TonB-dependent receptor [Marinoscillum sp. 108]VXD11442.1 Nicotinate-nucleotide adenylyltransferase [Marinoscillum sp. 108]
MASIDMESFKKLTTKEKALSLNLDDRIYGTIAEIGGGQEVADYFFKAGAASGTIAKTMSAYDMTFSDAIYGKSERYVCEDKLMRMLNREYSLLSQRLTQRAKRSHFFAFANTVETINYKRTNEGHGWIGLRFQKHPNSDPNDCVIHVILKDNDPLWQQQVLGMVGVNLIHACYNYAEPEDILNSLIDNIHHSRVEVDMFKIEGPDFHHVDNRLMSLKLVKNGLTHAAMFDPKGKVLQPSAVLYKKNIFVLRGRFRPVTHVNVDMMLTGMRAFRNESDVEIKNIMPLVELTLNDLTMEGEVDETDFLDRVDLLCSLGQNVLISNYQEHYKLASYLSKFTRHKKLGIVLGYYNLQRIFDESYYENLKGGILESFGRLFGSNVKLYVYPAIDANSKEIVTSENFTPEVHLKNLYQYLKDNDQIEDVQGAKTENLHIISDDVLRMIENGEVGWEKFVPNKVSDAIKDHHLFNFPYEVPLDEEDL